MSDLADFRGCVRGLSEPAREALTLLLTRVRDDNAGTDGLGSALAAGMNALLVELADTRSEVASDRREFTRTLVRNGFPADAFRVTPFDR